MSFSPKSAEPVATDPLGEALDRLEASIAGSGALPTPRPKGIPPKSIAPEGAVSPAAAPRAANGVSPAARNGMRSAPPSEPVQVSAPAAATAPVPRPAKATAPAQIETWSGRAVGERLIPASAPKSREAPHAVREVAPLAKETSPAPRALPEKALPGKGRGRADTQPLAEDDFVPYFEAGEQEAVSIRRGNRRISGSPWRTIALVLVSQVAVVAIAALVAWPIMQRELTELRNAPVGAAGVVGEGVEPAVVAEVDRAEFDALRAEIGALRQQLSVTPGEAWKELEYLGERNRLLELADRAIDTADREAFDKLVVISGGASDDRLRAGAVAEVLRVRFAYRTGIRSESHTLPVGQLFPSLRGKSEMELSTDQLVKVLLGSESAAADRTKAAYLLADRRGGKAADALAKAVAEDKNLDVVREAAMTFSEMTGYRSANLLDTRRLGQWWEVNAARVKAVVGD